MIDRSSQLAEADRQSACHQLGRHAHLSRFVSGAGSVHRARDAGANSPLRTLAIHVLASVYIQGSRSSVHHESEQQEERSDRRCLRKNKTKRGKKSRKETKSKIRVFFKKQFLYILFGIFCGCLHEVVDGLLKDVLLDGGAAAARTGHGLGGRGGARQAGVLGLGRRQKLLLGLGRNVQRLAPPTIQKHDGPRHQCNQHHARRNHDPDKGRERKASIELLLLRLLCRRLQSRCKNKIMKFFKQNTFFRLTRSSCSNRVAVRLHAIQRTCTSSKIDARRAVRVN